MTTTEIFTSVRKAEDGSQVVRLEYRHDDGTWTIEDKPVPEALRGQLTPPVVRAWVVQLALDHGLAHDGADVVRITSAPEGRWVWHATRAGAAAAEEGGCGMSGRRVTEHEAFNWEPNYWASSCTVWRTERSWAVVIHSRKEPRLMGRGTSVKVYIPAGYCPTAKAAAHYALHLPSADRVRLHAVGDYLVAEYRSLGKPKEEAKALMACMTEQYGRNWVRTSKEAQKELSKIVGKSWADMTFAALKGGAL